MGEFPCTVFDVWVRYDVGRIAVQRFLEYPASRQPVDISTLGLLCFVPGWYEADGRGALLGGDLTWIEVDRDAEAFVQFPR